MKAMTFLATIAVLATGCTKEEDFVVDFEQAYCDAYDECVEGEDSATQLPECDWRDALDNIGYNDSSCKYNSGKAKSCIEDLETSSCNALNVSMPSSCREVYSNCD